LNNQAWALLISCSINKTAPPIRYIISLSVSGIASYAGTLLLLSNGNFISLITIPDANSSQSAI
jgi:hypothetical protein